jgi:hypothetical protein
MPDDIHDAHAAIGKAKNSAAESGDTSSFMSNAVKGLQTLIKSGPIGGPISKAAADAWTKFHDDRGGPDRT